MITNWTKPKKMTEETFEQGEAQEIAEEVVETVEETEETTETPTLEDFYRLQKEVKTLKAQKEHFKKKATQTKGEETLKTNTQNGLSREEAILFAKGLTEDEINLAAKIAQVNGTSLIKATEDEFFQAKLNARKQEERSRNAQLGASTGFTSFIPTNLSDEEHEAQARKILANL